MSEQIGDVWKRIVRWLAANAPTTAAELRGPAEAAVVARIERDAGVPLPADLRAWWALSDGIERYRHMSLIPAIHKPLPTAAARTELAHLRKLWKSADEDWDDEDADDAEAGSYSHRYQRLFVPVSEDGCGQVLFVDLRPGPWHGSVSEWDKESAFTDEPGWLSVTAMLTDIADALETGGPARTDYTDRRQPRGFDTRFWADVNDNGELIWTQR